MSSDDLETKEGHKTGRIVVLSLLMLFLGIFFFAYKVEACKSGPEKCKEEFHEIQPNTVNNFVCDPGAIVETVNSPPSPKAGIICHCSPQTPTTAK